MRVWPRIATQAFLLAIAFVSPVAYLALALLPDGWWLTRGFLGHWSTCALVALAVTWGALAALIHRRRPCSPAMAKLALSAAATLVALVAADIGVAEYRALPDTGTPRGFTLDLETRRVVIALRRYYPTEGNFQSYAPNVSVSGRQYGDLLMRRIARPPEFAPLVQSHEVSYTTDAHGFLETTPLETAEVLALGDSFTACSTTQTRCWVKVLERRLGIPVYNLGVTGAAPRQEVLLLEHVLSTGRPSRVRYVLWMIFEGNDLEDTTETRRPALAPRAPRSAAGRALVTEVLRKLARRVRDESIIRQFVTGHVTLGWGGWSPNRGNRVLVYNSEHLGAKAFDPHYVWAAGLSREDIDRHPGRTALEETFGVMRELAGRRRIRVTVLIAPSAERLHGRHFRDFPPVTAEPHFIALIAELARRHGFGVLDLQAALSPNAGRELLYYRDDTHWNERGNELVAAAIARGVFGAVE